MVTEQEVQAKMDELDVTGFSCEGPFDLESQMLHLLEIEKIVDRRTEAVRMDMRREGQMRFGWAHEPLLSLRTRETSASS